MVKRMVEQARQQGYAGEGIKTIVYGGAPMYLADLDQALETFGPRLVQIYGQGECPMSISALAREAIADRDNPDWPAIAASVGRAQSCVEVQVINAQGRVLAPGEAGEIAVRGAPVMLGYWDNPATQAALVGGWLLTGDIGFLDTRGYLTLTDRSKDVIISGAAISIHGKWKRCWSSTPRCSKPAWWAKRMPTGGVGGGLRGPAFPWKPRLPGT